MKRRLLTALAAGALLLVTMPGLAAAGKPVPPELTLTPVRECDGSGDERLSADVSFKNVRGNWVTVVYHYYVRVGNSGNGTHFGPFEERFLNEPGASIPYVHEFSAGTDGQMRVSGVIAKGNGTTVSNLADTDWFSCS